MTTSERYRAILANHLPAAAVDWVYSYLDRYRVHFHITRGRRSKLGDYRPPCTGHQCHEMSVNGDLAPYLFLLVFLHEAAHLETRLHHGAVAPHGREWQGEYARLLVDRAAIFPPDVQPLIAAYTSRLPLSRSAGQRLEQALRQYGQPAAATLTVDDLAAGSTFRLAGRPDMELRMLERRRTRWLCVDDATGRRYTVSATAEVLP